MAEIVSYTEDEIRRAAPEGGFYTADAVIVRLQRGRDAHMHDFTDTDTITVKELREAWHRLRFDCVDGTPEVRLLKLLRDISRHREPEYPLWTVWKDAGGIYWYRTYEKMWKQFGTEKKYPDSAPQRPLYQMHEIPF